MLDFEFMLQIAPKMFSALWITVQLSCLAVLFSILFGAIFSAILRATVSLLNTL